jgi:hypothetical protein
MFSIKLVHPQHLTYPFFTPDGERRRWMNFGSQPHVRAIAEGIPVGHRAIVYVTGRQQFIWAIEYTGPVQDGRLIAEGSDLPDEWSQVFLPIRFLATVANVYTAPSAEGALAAAGVSFTPNAFPMKYISAEDYRKLFDAIAWQR